MTKLHWSFLMTAALIGCGEKDVDADGDGAYATVDCDDGDAAVYPGAPELCDGIDNDCNDEVDEDATDAGVYYADNDGDGYGGGAAQTLCDGSGYVDNADDCNDSSAEAYPGAAEQCDGLDNDCNGTIDDGSDITTFYQDADGDGYGSAKDSVEACVAPEGYVDNADDCEDYNDELNPETRWYPDNDGDGYGSLYGFVTGCEEPSGYLDNSDDCDDSSAETYPGAVAEDPKACMIDADGDGFGDNDPAPGVDPGTDCLDSDDRIYPGNVPEDTSLCMQDFDEDGYGDIDPDSEGVDAGTDCDDASSASYPGAPEYCDGDDNDCNGVEDDDYAVDAVVWYQDLDNDGYGDPDLATTIACDEPSGYTDNDEDCDDSNGDASPDELEDCTDGIDNNCNGSVDETCIYETDDVDVLVEADSGLSSSSYLGMYGMDATGDIDGDGNNDLIVGAYYADYYGYAYVFSGPLTGGSLEAGVDNSAAAYADTSYDYVGYQVTSGDVDGDGYDDLITSAPYAENASGIYSQGAVYVFYGPMTSELSSASADLSLWGASSYDYLGLYSIDAYDYDGDGAEEIVAGAYGYNSYQGAVGVFSDASDGDTIASAETLFVGSGTYNYLGYAFEPVGDLDGDGNNDLLVGSYNNNAAYVVYGPGTGSFSSTSADVTISGSSYGGGRSLASGDFNDDGYVDVIIGSYGHNSYAGGLHYLYGPITGSSYSVTSDADAVISGEASSEYLGYYDAGNAVGDVDGDGQDDLLAGSYYNASGNSYGGGAFLFYGALSGSYDLSDASVILYGDGSSYTGRGVSLGDLNNDGALDIVTGSGYAGGYGGEAYVLFNGTF